MGSRPLPHGRAPELHQKGARKKPSEKSPRQTLRVSPFGLPPFAQGMCAKVTVGRPSDWAGDCSRVTAMAVAADSHRISLLEDERAVTRRRLLLSTDPDKVYYNKKGEKSQDAAKKKAKWQSPPLVPSPSVSTLTLGMRELTKNSQLFLKKPLTIEGKRDIL